MSAVRMDLPDWLLSRPIAHRGLHNALGGVPENSLAAFEACVAARCPIELDVRLLDDGAVAVFHDRTVDRLTERQGPIARLHAADLQGLSLLGTGERVPLLQEVLSVIAGRVPLLLEIKCETPPVGPITQAVCRVLRGYDGPYAVQSFNPFVLRSMRRLAPGVPLGLLSGWKIGASFVGLGRPDMLCQEVCRLEDTSVQRARRKGLPVLAWVVRDEPARRAAARLADNYIFEGSP